MPRESGAPSKLMPRKSLRAHLDPVATGSPAFAGETAAKSKRRKRAGYFVFFHASSART